MTKTSSPVVDDASDHEEGIMMDSTTAHSNNTTATNNDSPSTIPEEENPKKRKSQASDKKKKKKKKKNHKKAQASFRVLNVQLLDPKYYHTITKEDVKKLFPDAITISRNSEKTIRVAFAKEQDCLKYCRQEKKKMRKRDLLKTKEGESKKEDKAETNTELSDDSDLEENEDEKTTTNNEEQQEHTEKTSDNKASEKKSLAEEVAPYKVKKVIHGFKVKLCPEKVNSITNPEWKTFTKDKSVDAHCLCVLLDKNMDDSALSRDTFMKCFPTAQKAFKNGRRIVVHFESDEKLEKCFDECQTSNKLEKNGFKFYLRRATKKQVKMKKDDWSGVGQDSTNVVVTSEK